MAGNDSFFVKRSNAERRESKCVCVGAGKGDVSDDGGQLERSLGFRPSSENAVERVHRGRRTAVDIGLGPKNSSRALLTEDARPSRSCLQSLK